MLNKPSESWNELRAKLLKDESIKTEYE